MTVGDFIQIAGMLILFATLGALLWQTILQSRLLQAQILTSRYEMYWQTGTPASDEEIHLVKESPELYMSKELYDSKYKDNDSKIRLFIYLSETYEYLAHLYLLKNLRIPDPAGYNYTELWTKKLLHFEEFRDTHEEYRGYYPLYEAYIDGLIRGSNTLQKGRMNQSLGESNSEKKDSSQKS